MGDCTCPTPPENGRGIVHLGCPIHAGLARAAVMAGAQIIQDQPPGRCELCGDVAETRPYGPKGEEVCHPCGMKDAPAAIRAFGRLMGEDPEVIEAVVRAKMREREA